MNNNIKLAFRNLKSNKGFTAINIIGLAIGMAASMLILLWVNHQFSINNNFPKSDQIYAVGTKEPTDNDIAVWFGTPKPLVPALKTDVPEVKSASRLNGTRGFLFQVGDKKLVAGVGAFVDPSFLSIFDFPLYSGNPANVLTAPNQIVLSEKLAKDMFGSVDVVGQTVHIDSTEILSVSAVLKAGRADNGFQGYEYYLPWSLMEKLGQSDENWGNSSVYTYVELDKNANVDQINKQFNALPAKHSKTDAQFFLKPLSKVFLYNKYENGEVVGGRIEMVRIFIVIAVFILLIACINFMNLSTAQSEKRSKEVGIRKVVGAQKSSLVFQFLSESLLLATFSGILSLLLVFLCLPSFNELVGLKMQIPFQELGFWVLFLGFIILTGILAGIYPAFFLSSFNPIKVLKGRFRHIRYKLNPRKILVVTQFAIAILLIISTLVIRKQIQHAQDRDYGYKQENLIFLPEFGNISKNAALIKQELIAEGIAQSVTRMMSPLTERWSGWNGFTWEGKDPNAIIQFNRQTADDKVVETAGFELVAGRDFDLGSYATDSTAAIINETAAKAMGFKDPIGQYFMDGSSKFQIIGVIKDFIQESPFEPVKPLLIEGASSNMNTMHIRFNPQLSSKEALDRAEKVLKKYNPDFPFDYKFIDEAYARKFEETERTGKLATLFAGLTIFISCLGLFGLAAFMAESRTKEIGIRKVLGASVFSVTRMLSKEFVGLVLVSCLIAFPIGYWAMDKFLSNYSYRIELHWGVFLIAGFGAVLITIFTVSFQSIKAAIANPVKSLRDE